MNFREFKRNDFNFDSILKWKGGGGSAPSAPPPIPPSPQAVDRQPIAEAMDQERKRVKNKTGRADSILGGSFNSNSVLGVKNENTV